LGEKEKMPHNNSAGIAISGAKCQLGFSAGWGEGDMAEIVKDVDPVE